MQKNNYSIFGYYKMINNSQIIRISKFIKNPQINLNNKQFLIYFDISYNEILKNIETIIKKLIYKIYFYHKRYILIMPITLKTMENIPMLNKLLHLNQSLLNKYLLLEQLINILKETSIIIDYQTKETKIPKKTIKHYKHYLLENLNEDQLKSVKQIKGPQILLAPAGSGKTKTLVNRIVYLMNQGIASENILVLAFNKKAELELTNRLYQNFKIKTNIKTFHSFGNQLLKKYLNYSFDIDNYEQSNLEMIKQITSNKLNYLQTFTNIKNNLLTKIDISDNQTWLLYEKYLINCQKEKIYTFDDMIYLSILLMLEDKNIRNEIQNQYQYILIDEFQDLNKAQAMLINIIAKPQDNIFVVGDDDQMIYRFRGASEKLILDFPNKFGICFKNVLNINYRCPTTIVKNAKKVISNNSDRVEKNTESFIKKEGLVNLIIADDIISEAQMIVNYIKKNKTEHNHYQDFAILYRYHQYGDLIKVILRKNNIPVVNNDLELLKTKVGKIILNYLNLLIEENPKQNIIYNCLIKFDSTLPKEFLEKIKKINDLFNKKIIHKYLNKNQLLNYLYFINKIKTFRNDNDVNLKNIIKNFNLDKYFKQDNVIDEQSASNQETLKIILNISNIVGNIKDLYYYFNNNKSNSNDSVILTTVHKTKGNEYKNVIYFHVVEQINGLIEDERRLFYVAITRALNSLLISSVKKETSLFIKEYFLDQRLIKYKDESLILILVKFNFKQAVLNQNIKKEIYKINEYKKLNQLINLNKELIIYRQLLKEKKQNNIIIRILKKEINYRKILI